MMAKGQKKEMKGCRKHIEDLIAKEKKIQREYEELKPKLSPEIKRFLEKTFGW